MRLLINLIFIIALASSAFAHRLVVFAVEDGGMLSVSSAFTDGTPCKNCAYTINAGDETIFSGNLSPEGETEYRGELPETFTVKVDAGMGHSGEMTLARNQAAAPDEQPLNAPSQAVDNDELRLMIRQELAKQTGELRLEIETHRSSLDKIMAGLGYIFGIFGLFMVFRRK